MSGLRAAQRLDLYDNSAFDPGASIVVRIAWYLVSALVFESKLLPISAVKRGLLRAFGAKVGRGVVIKPGVKIKFPWKLTVADHVWIGEAAWIDNLTVVLLESHVCISQGVYLCTGSHNATRETFDLITQPITVQSGAWLAARCTVLPGVTIGKQAVVYAGAVVARSVPDFAKVAGVPARPID